MLIPWKLNGYFACEEHQTTLTASYKLTWVFSGYSEFLQQDPVKERSIGTDYYKELAGTNKMLCMCAYMLYLCACRVSQKEVPPTLIFLNIVSWIILVN